MSRPINPGCVTLDITMHHGPLCPDGPDWAQARYLVHGIDDVLWTDDLDAALAYLREDCLRMAAVNQP